MLLQPFSQCLTETLIGIVDGLLQHWILSSVVDKLMLRARDVGEVQVCNKGKFRKMRAR